MKTLIGHHVIYTMVFFLLFTSLLFAQATTDPTYFTNPPSNFQAMNIWIKGAMYNGAPLKTGDEIAVLDAGQDNYCVGAKKLLKDMSADGKIDGSFISVEAYKWNGADRGFVEGSNMVFAIYDASAGVADTLKSYNVTFYENDGVTEKPPVTFVGQGTAVIEIDGGGYVLTIGVDPALGGTTLPVPGDYVYEITANAEVTISAFPETGYKLDHWTVNDTIYYSSGSITVKMNRNNTVTAHFEQVLYSLIVKMRPTVGTVVPSIERYYQAESWIDIFAKVDDPNSGYLFDHWEADQAGTQFINPNQASTKVYLDEDKVITAVFLMQQFDLKLNVQPPEAGKTSPDTGKVHVFDYGHVLDIVALPNKGWKFKQWTGDVASPDSATSITVLSDMNVTAEFEKKSYTLQYALNDTTKGELYVKFDAGDEYVKVISGDTVLKFGDKVYFMGKSKNDKLFQLTSWTGFFGGNTVTKETSITLTVDSNLIVNANFTDILPVEFSSFSASKSSFNMMNEVLLRWQTASETNNFGFNVERSFLNQENWQMIGFIEGAGTTNSTRSYQFIDNTAGEAGKYYYRLKQIDTNGEYAYSDIVEFEVNVPKEFALKQNFPNPFNPQTEIIFQLMEEVDVNITVYDILGREIQTLVNERMKAGTHRVTFHAEDMGAGLYFYSIKAGSFSATKKMTLVK